MTARRHMTAAEAIGATEAPYKLSAVMRALLELPEFPENAAVRSAVAAYAADVALVFKRETGDYGAPLHDLLREWSEHHFGRQLEPMPRGVLAFEIQYPRAEVKRVAPVFVPGPTVLEYLRGDRGRAASEDLAAAKALPPLPDASVILDVFEEPGE